MTVAMLSLHWSSDNCRSRRAEANFTHNVRYRYSCHFARLEFMKLPQIVEDLLFIGTDMVQFSEYESLLLGRFIGTGWQCRHIRCRRCNVCRTKKDRKPSALWGIHWYHKKCNITDEVSHKPSSL
jgi:hypothetical protein